MLNSSGFSALYPSANSLQQAANQAIDLKKYVQTTDTVTSILNEVHTTFELSLVYWTNPLSCYRYTTTCTYRPASLLSNNHSGAFLF